MKTIWIYSVHPGYNEHMIPEGYQILSVHTQFGIPQIWVQVDPKNSLVPVWLFCAETGHNFPENIKLTRFIGTFLIESDALVFHLFEIKR